jgi:hypothetical protein
MTSSVSDARERSTRARAFVLAVLAGITFVALALRVPSIAEPLGIDQGLLASAAYQLSRGQTLYRDVWDQKPPGIYLTYVAAFATLGRKPSSVAWFDILASSATALLLFAIVRRLSDVTMGAAAAALYAALTMPAWLYRHGGFLERSVAETFIVVFVALAAWCATHVIRKPSIPFAIGLGLFSSMAVLYKPNAGGYFIALLAWAVLYRQWTEPRVVRVLVVAMVSTLIAPAVMLGWFWSHGVLDEARVALIDFNRAYVSTGFSAERYGVDFMKAVWLRMKTDPLWAAGGIGVLAAAADILRTRRLDAVPALAVAWGAGAALAIVVNGARLFNSYFIQALAPLAMLAAWHLTAAVRGTTVRRIAGVATAIVMLLLLLVRSNYPARVFEFVGPDFDQLRGNGDRTAYLELFGGYANGRGYSARANHELAAYIRTHTEPNDLIYQFGINSASVYFDAERLAAHGFMRVNMFVMSDLQDPRFQLPAVTQQIAARRPMYLIFEELHTATALGKAVDNLEGDPEIVKLLTNYRQETTIEDFTLYRRMD